MHSFFVQWGIINNTLGALICSFNSKKHCLDNLATLSGLLTSVWSSGYSCFLSRLTSLCWCCCIQISAVEDFSFKWFWTMNDLFSPSNLAINNAPHSLSLSHTHTHIEVGVHSTTTEGSLFSGWDTNTAVRLSLLTCAHVRACVHTHTHTHKHTHTHTHTRSSVLVSWLPYCTLAVFNKWSSVYLCVCRLIRQPFWPHVTSSVSSAPLTLLSTTDHPPSPSLLQGSVAWNSGYTHTRTHTLAICLLNCEACTN